MIVAVEAVAQPFSLGEDWQVHQCECSAAIGAIGIAERFTHFGMVVVPRFDQLDGMISRPAAEPGTAVNEQEYRRIWHPCAVNIEFLDVGRPIVEAQPSWARTASLTEAMRFAI